MCIIRSQSPFCVTVPVRSVSRKNPVMHSKTKHIPIKYHFLREHVLEKIVNLEHIGTKDQVADIFTKPIPKETFEYLRQKLGIITTPQ